MAYVVMTTLNLPEVYARQKKIPEAWKHNTLHFLVVVFFFFCLAYLLVKDSEIGYNWVPEFKLQVVLDCNSTIKS